MRNHIKYYFSKNILEYLKVFIVFIVGIVVAVITINNSNEFQKKEIKDYIDEKINIVKNNDDYNNGVFIDVMKENGKNVIMLAFLSSSLIGIPFAYWLVAKKGFSIGYTISAIYATQSTKTAIIFICNSMLIHNIIYMVSIGLVLVAGTNLVKAMIDKDRKNVRFELFRYIVFLAIGFVIILVASIFEVHISTIFLSFFKKYLWKLFTIWNSFDIT